MTDFLISQAHVIPPDVSLREIALGGRLPDNKFFPAGTRLLRCVSSNGGDEERSCNHSGQVMAILGIPRNPLDFLAEVRKLVHPTLQKIRLSPMLDSAINLQSDR